jgi:hypothetical protein
MLGWELEEDRETLERLMGELGVEQDPDVTVVLFECKR